MSNFILREYLEDFVTAKLNTFLQNSEFSELLEEGKTYPAVIKLSKPNFGDYQVNGVLPLAKVLKTNVKALSERFAVYLLEQAPTEFVKTESAGPGFINLYLNDAWLAGLTEIFTNLEQRVKTDNPKTIVVDYSSPNIAKEMHVGHLRTTIIGDSLVRILSYLGHKVIKANHIGDWGTQFGMLIAYLEEVEQDPSLNVDIADLDRFYRAAKARFDADPAFQDYARGLVVKLQAHDPHYLAQWKRLVDITMSQNNETYRRLGVLLTDDDIMGESLYNPMLAQVVEDAIQSGHGIEDQGAIVIKLPEFTNREGDEAAIIIRKSDGGYLYATTDIAAVKYRQDVLKADKIVYCTDSRQAQHFQQIELITRRIGYLAPENEIVHVGFGMMLGDDGRPFKSRSGDVVKLKDLLDEAVERTQVLLESRASDITGEDRKHLIDSIAYGSIKYSELSKNRTTDYIFDWDKMISFEGNTAPYMQYAYSRIRSISRRLEQPTNSQVLITNEYERNLVLKLLEFTDVLNNAGNNYYPHLICTYIYDLTSVFNALYEHVNIMNTEDPALKASRITLINYTAAVIKTSLNLLGINVVERM